MGEQPTEARRKKDAILAEVFIAYKGAATAYHQTANPEVRSGLLEIKRGCDLIITRLMPLNAEFESLRAECAGKFHARP